MLKSPKRQSLRRRTMKARNKVKNKKGIANPVYSMAKAKSFSKYMKSGK